MIRSCAICGKEFDAKTRGKYCSQICADEARRINHRERWRKQNPGWDKGTSKVCEYCGEEFVDKSRAKIARFCSVRCRDTLNNRAKGIVSWDERRSEWEKQKEETQKRRAKERAEKRKANHRIIICSECGKTVDVYGTSQKTCSAECSKIRRNRLAKERKDKRLNNANIVDKDISLKTLYKRDKGICYICGGKCDFKDHTRDGSNFISGPTYPSVDHIVPLARGGKHSWDNIKLAHHLCNAKKSDILPSELELDVEINDAYALARKVSPRKKQVKQFTKDGKLIATYESTIEASKQTGLKAKGIQNCARGERPSQGGYLWSY